MNKITITGTGTYNITEDMGTDIVLYSATQLPLSGDVTIAYSDTPYESLKLNLYMACSFGTTSGVRAITILGTEYQHILFATQNAMEITAIYVGSAWKLYSKASNIVPELATKTQDVEDLVITSGGTVSLIDRKNRLRFNVYGTLSISSTYEIKYHASTLPRVGEPYEFTYNGVVTYANTGCSVKILGRELTQAEALSGELHITAVYTTASGWSVNVLTEVGTATTDFSVTLTDAEVKALYDTPIKIVTGGTGKIVALETIFVKKVGATVYATNTNLMIMSETATDSLYENPLILASDVDGLVQTLTITAPSGTLTPLKAGEDLYVTVETGNPSGGGEGMGLTIFGSYRLLTA